jgi:hypothetical protein
MAGNLRQFRKFPNRPKMNNQAKCLRVEREQIK